MVRPTWFVGVIVLLFLGFEFVVGAKLYARAHETTKARGPKVLSVISYGIAGLLTVGGVVLGIMGAMQAG